jgi:hypothetical protein
VCAAPPNETVFGAAVISAAGSKETVSADAMLSEVPAAAVDAVITLVVVAALVAVAVVVVAAGVTTSCGRFAVVVASRLA